MADEQQNQIDNQNQGDAQEEQGNFTIQRIYLKDASFESPSSPGIFMESWEPEIDVNLHTRSQRVEENMHEVVLKVNVTATQKDKTVFIAEVEQAGIFSISQLEGDELRYILGSFCPSLLFPYVRETISNFVGRGGFPYFYLAPIDFDQVYQQHMEQQQQEQQSSEQSQ